jgi:hypothetical protein
MSTRSYKWTIGILVCLVAFFAWRCFVLYGERINATFISHQCEMTDEISSYETNPEALAYQVQFLQSYYQYHSKALEGSPLHRIVTIEYQNSLTNAVSAFRRITTNDLGGDINDWLKKYGEIDAANQSGMTITNR